MSTEEYTIYTDGGARGNPGPAGAGALIQDADGNTVKEVSQYLGRRTNNWAEYEAVALGLEALRKQLGTKKAKTAAVTVKLDSELVVKQLNGEYQVREETLYPQFMQVWNLRVQMPNTTFTHIPRAQNKRADALANQAMDNGA